MKRAWLITIIMAVILLAVPRILIADDTEIYGTVTISLQPNILIIFDNSGSMGTVDIGGEYYDPATTYSGPYSTNTVYQKSRGSWVWFANDVNSLNCESVKQELLTKGYATRARIYSGSYTCGGSQKTLRLGNYMNYDESGVGDARSRISVAKEVITNLITITDNVRFGLMIFNESEGGHIVSGCGTDKTTLINTINALSATTWTPLAETLAEAGLYFAGKQSWFNGSTTYTSPMEERCQKNYIILMTDGAPTMDNNTKLTSGTYINGDTIGDYDGDGSDPGWYESYGTDYLDDVAKYLYENDCNPTLGTGTSFEKQNITTYTIGFKTDQQLLQDTALNGGGDYYTANSISGLSEAFEAIMSNISEANAMFVSPVVPVSRMNRTYAGDRIYLGFFKPQQSGTWLGNLKKYGLDSNGNLIDVNGNLATMADGTIKDNALSYWSPTPDGPNVAAGGVGEVMLDQASRSIYTYMGTQSSLIHADNLFSADNALITNTTLGVTSDSQRISLINDIYGYNSLWILGDILHSEPAIIHYSSTSTILFAGSNDGMMHCFDDSDGRERWAFIPPNQLGRLPLLLTADHDYFVDGSPVVHEGTSQKILFFGERRGGNNYYALDVSSVTSPSYLYTIHSDILGAETLGQSWCKPEICTIQTSSGSETVFLMTGGYDTNQDASTPESSDNEGRSVFAIKTTNGALSSLNFNANNFASMTHCIVSTSGFDTDSDAIVNSVYAGDLGGNMFAFEDNDKDGTWSGRKLFSAPIADGTRKKIFYAPDGVKESFGEVIFFGTGDRADPGETGVVNRMYSIKNNWEDSGTFTTITESDLVDVTDDLIQMGTDEQKIQTAEALKASKGWYIRLEHTGEKVTASPTVFAGVVYFTTYTPASETSAGDPEDPCGAPTARGVARLYAVNYLTGGAVHDYNSTTETDAEGEVVERGKQDRVKEIGTAIPTAPIIAVRETGPKIYIGIEGGVAPEDPVATMDINVFYWRELHE
ncbi:MAG TPA: PilC/PilY family type IV pilus protein [Syntrophales bacterium]|nr:PilC/PilY family type IV pilus protein [Syntrophales bacterium]